MPLEASNIAENLKAFITKLNEIPQQDKDSAINAYCQEFQKEVFAACRNITITIPAGAIIVATAQGPAANPAPIILNGAIS